MSDERAVVLDAFAAGRLTQEQTADLLAAVDRYPGRVTSDEPMRPCRDCGERETLGGRTCGPCRRWEL